MVSTILGMGLYPLIGTVALGLGLSSVSTSGLTTEASIHLVLENNSEEVWSDTIIVSDKAGKRLGLSGSKGISEALAREVDRTITIAVREALNKIGNRRRPAEL